MNLIIYDEGSRIITIQNGDTYEEAFKSYFELHHNIKNLTKVTTQPDNCDGCVYIYVIHPNSQQKKCFAMEDADLGTKEIFYWEEDIKFSWR